MATYNGTSNADSFAGTASGDSFLDIGINDSVDGALGADSITVNLAAATDAVLYDAIQAATSTGTAPLAGMSINNVERLTALTTGSGNDQLTISLAQGAFTWEAGDGNDTLVLDYSATTNTIVTGRTAAGFTINVYLGNVNSGPTSSAQNIESVRITGGGSYGDYLAGIDGSDYLDGRGGHDTLFDGVAGTPGNDTLLGGPGYDTLYSQGGIDSIDGGGEADTVSLYRTYLTSDLIVDMAEAAKASGTTLVDGTFLRYVEVAEIHSGSGHDLLVGRSGSNRFFGGPGSDALIGGTGRDSLDGGDGDDLLNGGGGPYDTLSGGAGNDWLEVTGGFNSMYGDDGHDTLTGGVSLDWVYGGDGDDVLDGGGGVDSLYGEAGNDSVSGGNDGDSLYGAAGNDSLSGGDSNDSLYGGELSSEGDAPGNDVLNGDGGNDYLYSHGGVDTIDGGVGSDLATVYRMGEIAFTIDMSAAITAGGTELVDGTVLRNLEAIAFWGGSGADVLLGGDGWDLFKGGGGNDHAWGGAGSDWLEGQEGNDTLTGQRGDDTLKGGDGRDEISGSEGHDSMVGGAGADSLYGGDGNDLIDGEGDADVLIGHVGNDTYMVDNVGDRVVENHFEGSDLIRSSVSYSLFGRAIEALVLTGTAHVDAVGNSLGNSLTGNFGNNRLDGGTGNDTMTGGLGNDTYVVELAGDVVVEGANAGIDTVESHRTWTLGANFENLTLTGTNHVNATGNAGNNVLTGNVGNNVLTGGLGNDTYYIQNTADQVVETWDVGSGIDQIYSSVTYSLFGRPVENITLTGEGHSDATGNSFANRVVGNGGNNTINGMNGNDTLSGGEGADTFLFLAGSGVDTVTDFSAAQGDWINVNAYSGGVENGGGISITQSGADALINLGGGHSIRVLNITATDTAFLDQIVW